LAIGIEAGVATTGSFEVSVKSLIWTLCPTGKILVSPAGADVRKSTAPLREVRTDELAMGFGACDATTVSFEFSVKPLTWTPCLTGAF
jgi:hypothetical protein